MADEKIYPDMPDIGAPGSADVLPIVRPGDTTNYSITMAGIAAYAQGALIPAAGLVYSTGSALADATMGAGVSFTSGTLDNTGVLSLDTATGALLIGAGLQRSSQTFSVKPATTAAIGGIIAGANTTIDGGGTLSVAAPGTGTLTQVIAAGVLSGGTITGSGTVGLAVSTGLTLASAGTIAVAPATTADLGGVIPGANVTINSGGTISVAAPGTGTVTAVVAGANLTGGTITSTGTVALAAAITITDTTAKLVLDRNTGGTLDTLGSIYLHNVGADGVNVKEVIDGFAAVPQYIVRRADGTRASKTTIQSGDTLGLFGAAGYDGTNYSFGGATSANMQAGMAAVAVQNWTTAAHGVNLVLSGIPSNSTTVTGFATLSSTGAVLSGGTLSTAGNTMVLGGNFATAGALTFSGAFPVTIRATGTTDVTLPTSGTLGTGSVTQVIANGALSGGTITTTGTVGLAVSTGLTIAAAGTIATTASTRAFNFSFDVGNVGTFVADTYKSMMPAAGTVLNAYAIGGTGGTITAIPQIFVVTSNTLGAGAAITGIGTLTSGGSLTVQVAGTASAANTFAAGDYLGFVGAISSGVPVGTKVNISGTYN